MNLAVGPSTTQRVDTKSIQILQENQKHLKKVKYVCMVNSCLPEMWAKIQNRLYEVKI